MGATSVMKLRELPSLCWPPPARDEHANFYSQTLLHPLSPFFLCGRLTCHITARPALDCFYRAVIEDP